MQHLDHVNSVLSNIYNGSFTTETLKLIASFDTESREVCLGSLYLIYEHDMFYSPDNKYIEYRMLSDINQRLALRTKNFSPLKPDYQCENLLPPHYSQYDIIKERFAFEYFCLRSSDIDEIYKYPTSEYITNELILVKIFNLKAQIYPTNEFTKYGQKMKFINKIIKNKDQLDNCADKIIDEYLEGLTYYKSGLEIGIAESHLRFVLGYIPFLLIIKKLSDNNIQFSFNIKAFAEMHNPSNHGCQEVSILSNFKSIVDIIMYQHSQVFKKRKYEILLNKYLSDYSVKPSFPNFVNVAQQYYNLFDISNLIAFYKSNMEMVNKLLEWKQFEFLFVILFRPYNCMLKEPELKERELDLFNILDTKFYNAIMKYDSHNGYYKFLLHRIEEDDECKKLKDEEGRVICVVCLDDLVGKSILCVSCNKYIGHPECIKKSASIYQKCPYCNVGY